MGLCWYHFCSQDVSIFVRIVLSFQIKNSCFITTWHSSLCSEGLHVQATKHFQKKKKKADFTIMQRGVHYLVFTIECYFAVSQLVLHQYLMMLFRYLMHLIENTPLIWLLQSCHLLLSFTILPDYWIAGSNFLFSET